MRFPVRNTKVASSLHSHLSLLQIVPNDPNPMRPTKVTKHSNQAFTRHRFIFGINPLSSRAARIGAQPPPIWGCITDQKWSKPNRADSGQG
jgi:hypothetical protein